MRITEINIYNDSINFNILEKIDGIVKFYKKLKRKINFSFGVEIEGEWNRDNWEMKSGIVYNNDVAYRKGDGSIKCFHDGVGSEITSKVIRSWTALKNFLLYIRDMYLEIGLYPNKSCGVHFHIGGDILMYLANIEFARFIVEYLTKNEEVNLNLREAIKEKIDGDYLKDEEITGWTDSWASIQFTYGDTIAGSRYKAVNFQALESHNTIEFRMFFTPPDFESFLTEIAFLLKGIMNWIEIQDKKKEDTILEFEIKLKDFTKKITDEDGDEIEIGDVENFIEGMVKENTIELIKTYYYSEIKVDLNKEIKTDLKVFNYFTRNGNLLNRINILDNEVTIENNNEENDNDEDDDDILRVNAENNVTISDIQEDIIPQAYEMYNFN